MDGGSTRAQLGAYVPRLVAAWDAVAPGARARLVEGSLLAADVSGFTRLSERLAGLGRQGAEELTEMLNACFGGMIAAAEAHGGDVLKFGGDALLVLFTGPGHAERACHAAVAMRETIARPVEGRLAGRVRLRMSQGVHSGPLAMVMADCGHRELIVAGAGASRTVRMEAVAAPGQVVVSRETAELLPPGWLGAAVGEGRALRRRLVGPPAPAAVEAVHDATLAHFLPAALRECVIGVAGVAEHRQVTIAFVAVPGTDAIAAEGIDALAGAIQETAAAVAGAATEHGVHWLATDVMEDGVKVILAAGAPSGGGDDEERMLRALRLAMDRAPVALRVGVNRGHAYAGDLGSGRRRTYTVMGDAVNVAARLMGASTPGRMVAAREVLDRSRARFAVDRLPPLSLKGKSRPVEAVHVHQALDHGAEDPGRRFPFTGRAEALAGLEAAIAATAAARGRPVEVSGTTGVGKSRLVEELLARHPELPVVRMAGGQYRQEHPYLAVRRALRELAGIGPDAAPDEAGRGLGAWISRTMPELLPYAPLIAIPFDADVPATRESEETAPAFRRGRAHRLTLALLRAALPERGAIVVEDAHWLDEASRDLVGMLARLARRRGWLIVAVRTSGPPVLPQELRAEAIELGPLPPAESLELARAVLGARPGAEQIAERAAGNPLFLLELGEAAADLGPGSALPDSIEALVTARMDTLPPRDRLLLREAAVLGSHVEADALAEVVEDPSVRDPARWAPMAEFVGWTADGTALEFLHGVFREVAYEGLSFRRRRDVHRRAGEQIEARAGAAVAEQAEILSLHFHRAGEHDRAWRHSLAAGRRAQQRYANAAAADYYERALQNAAAGAVVVPGEVAQAAEALGDVCELAARYDRAAEAYAQARRLAGEGTAGARLMRKEGVIREREGRYVQALRWYGRARRALAAATAGRPDPVGAEVALASAGVRYRQGRYADGVRLAEEGMRSAERLGDRRQLGHAFYLLDLGYTYLRRPERERYRGRALPILVEVGDLLLQARVLNNLGAAAYYEGRWDEALERYSGFREASERAGDVVSAATAMNNVAEILSDRGELEEADGLLREARAIWNAAGYPIGVALATSNLGRAAARAGRPGEALELYDEAMEGFRAIGAGEFVIATACRRAECLLWAGRVEEALEEGRAVLATSGRAGADPVALAALHRTLGLAHLARGDPARAEECLRASEEEAADAPYERALTLLARDLVARGRGDAGAGLRDAAMAILGDLGAGGAVALPLGAP